MDWLYLTVMGYIVLSALRGYHRGFFRVIYSVAALIITIIFIAVSAPLFRNTILKSTTIEQQIRTSSEQYMKKQIEKKLEDGTFTNSIGLSFVALPKQLQKELNQAAQSEIPDLLESKGIYKQMAKAAAQIIVSVIAFFLSFAMISLILLVIRRKLDLFSRKPGIHLANMIFGFFAGIIKAFLVIWTMFLLIQATEILPVSAALIKMIKANAVLRGLYEQNQILELVKLLQFF